MSFLTKGSLLAIAVTLSAAATSMGSGVPSAVHYVDHDKITTMMAKSGTIASDPGLAVLAQRRMAGRVEYHEHTNHIFIIVEGAATMVVGGTMVKPEQTAPDQKRSDTVEGGETYHLSKGDVITIPAKTPHWFKEVSTPTIAYYAVNIESE